MPYTIKNPIIGAPVITLTDTTASPAVALGTIVTAEDPVYGSGQFIYLKGVASTTVGSWVTYYQTDYSTTLLAANDIGSTAVAMSANVANQYGWYQIVGKAIGKALTGFVDNALVYATATAGSVDDAVVAGDRVKLARGASAVGTPAAGLAFFEIQFPFMDDGSAA
ncbi:MAG: hypothetical protein ACRC5T_11175 [Cetobacterium sp.]